MKFNVPINKGNYSMETPEREEVFHRILGSGWEEKYKEYRRNWSEYPQNQYVSEYPLLVDAELSSFDGREFIVRNYVDRKQCIGE